MKLALLTMANQSKLAREGEVPLENALKRAGITFDWVVWSNHKINWREYDAAIIRTTWDYQAYYREFINTLEKIQNSGCLLLNALAVVKWNSDKNYLFELEKKGVPIIPTKKLAELPLTKAFDFFKTDEVIVKPTISASAHNTFLIAQKDIPSFQKKIEKISEVKELLVQPKVESVISEGEYSLHFFNRKYSHTILKTPKAGDFRSQEEYGSRIIPVEPERGLLDAAELILDKADLSGPLMYARVDLVRGREQRQWPLMELELIEPCLYFDTQEGLAESFVRELRSSFLEL